MNTPTPTDAITCDFDNSAAWTTKDFQKALQTIEKLRQEKRTQVAVAFGGYVEASEIARQLLTDVKAALAGGMSHSRSRLELAVSRHSTALNKLTFDAPPSIKTDVRLFDLVRYMRSELHQAELITDAEYAWLCSANPGESTADGSPSRERLESYDDLRAKLAASQAAYATARSQLVGFEAESAGLRADIEELLARLQERTESHLAASARDVQTIQRQSVLLDKMEDGLLAIKEAIEIVFWSTFDGNEQVAATAETLRNDVSQTMGDAFEKVTAALAAYESAKSGNETDFVTKDPLAEAVKPCDWKEDEDGNWYTSCHQFMCFEHAPPNEQGYKFCHRCGHPINFIEFVSPLDETPGPA